MNCGQMLIEDASLSLLSVLILDLTSLQMGIQNVILLPFQENQVYVSTYDNDLNGHSNNQFTLMSLPNATTFGILCEKGRILFTSAPFCRLSRLSMHNNS